jgi:hypothetical protein
MMSLTGWTDLVDDAKEIFKAVNNLAAVTSETELFFRKGQLDILQWMLSLKEGSETAYEQLLSGDNSDGS